MGYLHIDNLYKNQDILLFKQCWALEKVHGTSAHIRFDGQQLNYFSGGASHEQFKSLFNSKNLLKKIKSLISKNFIIYGEAYGGKMQGMSDTYGKELKFIAFDVLINNQWLDVPDAEKFCKNLDIDFVPYSKSSTDIWELNMKRDAVSELAKRLGFENKKMEGIVLRPLIEIIKKDGHRIICKHKRDDFRETKTPRTVDPVKLKILSDAKAIADEWVTEMRLKHVLEKIPNHNIEKMKDIILAMQEDIIREGENEIIASKEALSCIGKKTANIYKVYLKNNLSN